MMSPEERLLALQAMKEAAAQFYRDANRIGVHPFVEFSGLMQEYIKACEHAHRDEIDFTDCSVHTGKVLPMHSVMLDYVNEKLNCIFTGRVASKVQLSTSLRNLRSRSQSRVVSDRNSWGDRART